MKYLLDTNTCIAYLTRRSRKIEKILQEMVPADISLCSVVKYELIYGAYKSQKIDYNLSRLKLFFTPFECLPFDDDASILAGKIRAELERSGSPIGPADLLIGSIALSHGLVVVTRNTKEFSRIDGLLLEN
jgi:tRNA(fMet)-specific endonuclease VapC